MASVGTCCPRIHISSTTKWIRQARFRLWKILAMAMAMAMELAATASSHLVVTSTTASRLSSLNHNYQPWPGPGPCRFTYATHRPRSLTVTAASDTTKNLTEEDEQQPQPAVGDDDASFEERLAKLRTKVKSGSGKKAEKRKARKSGDVYSSSTSSSSSSKGSVLLPPIPLEDPISDGFPVELGFNSYTERLNGRLAALGLAAVLLVELATGGSFLKYHDGAVIGVQIYFILSVSALFIKYEKEKKSVWPKS